MLEVATVVLSHETSAGSHFDWLLEPPDAPGTGALVTWRCAVEPRLWPRVPSVALHPLPPHRRAYLRYEGPLTGGRGWVRRVDQGRAIIESWTASSALLTLRTRQFTGRVALRRVSPMLWVMGQCPSPFSDAACGVRPPMSLQPK